MSEPKYVVVLQCHITKEHCSGYPCEHAFWERSGGFAAYSPDVPLRFLTLTCGGCCGKATHRKLTDFLKRIKQKKEIARDEIVVRLSSCIVSDNYHGPACPHKEFIRAIVQDKLGLALEEMTVISDITEKRRKEGRYASI
jgi:predicted metal-binding protein